MINFLVSQEIVMVICKSINNWYRINRFNSVIRITKQETVNLARL